jgi:DNA end-binding protein Ku
MAARAIGSGTISFGLVSIPVKLYTAASSENVSFNMLHGKCGGRLKQQLYCPVDNEVVERAATVRGYEYQKDRYVQFTEEELKKLESPRTNELELMEFVPERAVDFVNIEKTYYLGPDKGGERAYRLLSDALARTQRIAVGKYWTRGKENVVLVRPYRKGLALHQVYYANEVRSFDDIETGGEFQFKDVEKELADKLIEQLSQPDFKIDRYKDEYQTRVMNAVDQKAQGQEVTAAPEAPKAQIIDLLEALKRSVSEAKAANAAGAEEPKPESVRPKGGPKKVEPKEEKAAEGKKKRTAG